jgi:hypothetical protein
VRWYRQGLVKTMNKEVDWDSDDLRITHHTSSYALNADTHDYVDDLTNELATGGGYTAGGLSVTGESLSYTAANSWSTQWAASTAYTADDVVRPTTGNGFLYRAVTTGSSGASQPTWPTTIGATVVDSGVTWSCVGRGIIVFDITTDPSWPTFTATGIRYSVLSDRTPGAAATQPLLGYTDWVTDQAGGGGSFTIQFSAQGVLQIFVP